jgi:hypothetical protein
LDEIYYPHSYPNQTVPPRVPSRGSYDGSNSVFKFPENINEEEDLDRNWRKKYRNSILKLKMNIRPIRNKNYNKRKSRSFNNDFNWEEQHNEIRPTFEEFNNNNSNYNDFIREFNLIHTPNYDNNNNNRLISASYVSSYGLLHPPDYNNSLLHPPNSTL